MPERATLLTSLFASLILLGIFGMFVVLDKTGYFDYLLRLVDKQGAASAVVPITGPFIYSFNVAGVLHETPSMEKSPSPYWWLDSGGMLIIEEEIGKTIQGPLSRWSRWQVEYAQTNAIDTDDGIHPQNLLRLVSRSRWVNVRQEAQFRITADHFSDSPNRNASNGLFLMSRYTDYQTLYYAGLRVDGDAVIKKKYRGVYYTMDHKEIFPGDYRVADKVNFLPHDEWIGVRSEVVTNERGEVTVRLYLQQRSESEEWVLLLEAEDRGQFGNTPPISEAGFTGIRTDFMDVEFDTYRLESI